MKTIKTLLAALVIACLGLATARADEKNDEIKPVPSKPQTTELTVEKLKEMIDLLGYNFREEKLANGNAIYYVKLTRKGMDYEVAVSLSSNKTNLWTTVALAELKPEHLNQADKLLKLLEINKNIGPSHFYFSEKYKFIYMGKALSNRGVTAKLLREHIDDVLENVITNEDHWNVKKWGTATANKTVK